MDRYVIGSDTLPSVTFDPDFKVTTFFEVEYLMSYRHTGSYYRTLIGNHTSLYYGTTFNDLE